MESENNNLETASLEPTQELVPETNAPTEPVSESEPVTEPGQVVEPEKVEVKPAKSGDNRMVGMVIVLAILALVGIAFGIAMAAMNMGKNEVVVKSFENPVIKNATDTGEWSEYYESTAIYVDGGTKIASMTLKNGEVEVCEIQGFADTTLVDKAEMVLEGMINECVVSGLAGDVYKIVEFGKGLTPETNYIGFIMTDGSVYYVKLLDAIADNNFAVKGPLNVGGYVVDMINVDVAPTEENPSGGVSTAIILRDGSIVEFDELMLN